MSPRVTSSSNKRLVAGGMAAAIVVLVAGVLAAAFDGDDGDDDVTLAPTTTSTTSTTSTTAEPAASTESTATAVTSTTSTTAALACAGRDPAGAGAPGREVLVYFSCGDQLVPVTRPIPPGEVAVLDEAMRQLVAGPSEAERAEGFSSLFPVGGADLERVVILGGTAVIGFSQSAPGALPGFPEDVAAFSSQVARTAGQFSSVERVEIHFGGSCEAFARWAQRDDCVVSA